MVVSQEIKDFKNPLGCWEHNGAFSVELVPGTDKNNAPRSAEVRGNTVRVRNGRIKQMTGAIQLYSEERPFYWRYSCIKVIRDGCGVLLWVNYDYR